MHKDDTASFAKHHYPTKKAAFIAAIDNYSNRGKHVLVGGGKSNNYNILGEAGHPAINELIRQVGAGVVTSYYVYCHTQQKKLKGSDTTSEDIANDAAEQHFIDTGGTNGGHYASVVTVVTKG